MPKGHSVIALAIVATIAASSLTMRAISQERREAASTYIGENGDRWVAGGPAGAERVSMVRLIADPARYDGKEVVTEGFFVWAYEDRSLYVSRDDALNFLDYNGLVLSGTVRSSCAGKDLRTSLTEGHLHFVTVQGTFHKLGRGHLNSYYSGTLSDIEIRQIHRQADKIPLLRMEDPEDAPPGKGGRH
jgi:hypothetical protein